VKLSSIFFREICLQHIFKVQLCAKHILKMKIVSSTLQNCGLVCNTPHQINWSLPAGRMGKRSILPFVEPTRHLLPLISLFLIRSLRWPFSSWLTAVRRSSGAVGGDQWGCGGRAELLAAAGAATRLCSSGGTTRTSRQPPTMWSSSCGSRQWRARAA
jgi:hypothetical protein